MEVNAEKEMCANARKALRERIVNQIHVETVETVVHVTGRASSAHAQSALAVKFANIKLTMICVQRTLAKM